MAATFFLAMPKNNRWFAASRVGQGRVVDIPGTARRFQIKRDNTPRTVPDTFLARRTVAGRLVIRFPLEQSSPLPATPFAAGDSTNFAKHRYKSPDNAAGPGRRYTLARGKSTLHREGCTRVVESGETPVVRRRRLEGEYKQRRVLHDVR